MIRYGKGESGVALVAVMIIILLLTILGAGLLSSALLENKIVHRLEDQKQAFYLAQAGIEYSRFQLQKDLTWRVNGEVQTLANGTFTLHVHDNGANRLRIRSTGSVGKVSKTLEVGVYYTQGKSIVEQLATYALLGGGSMSFGNNVELKKGDLRSNENITFSHNVTSDGQIIAGGTIVGSLSGVDVEENASVFPIPEIDWEGLRTEAIKSGRYLTSWEARLFRNGVVNYIDGSGLPDHTVEVSKWEDNISLDGILVIRGNLVFEHNNVEIFSRNGLMIFVDGNVTFHNNTTLSAAIFARGDIQFKNNATIEGAVYASGTIEFKNNTEITLEEKHLQIPAVETALISSGSGEDAEDSLSFTYWNEE